MPRIIYNAQPYRIPYMGGKQRIVYPLLQKLNEAQPNAKYFIDLFGGGGSVSLYALQCGYNVIYNELDKPLYYLFNFLIQNKIPQEWLKFITREDFVKLRDSNPTSEVDIVYKEAMLLCYSFGNNRTSYYKNPQKETFVLQGHNFVVFNDKEATQYLCNYFKPFSHIFKELHESIFPTLDWQNRYKWWVNLVLKIESLCVTNCYKEYTHLNALELRLVNNNHICDTIMRFNPNAPIKDYKKPRNDKRLSELKQLKQLKQLQRLEQLQQLQRLQQLEQLQRLQQLQQLQRLDRFKQNLTTFNLDYAECLKQIPREVINQAIIYCDSPYQFTTCGSGKATQYKKQAFDFDHYHAFFRDYAKQGIPIYFTEYSTPSDFYEICNFEIRRNMASQTGSLTSTERLFCNIKPKQKLKDTLF